MKCLMMSKNMTMLKNNRYKYMNETNNEINLCVDALYGHKELTKALVVLSGGLDSTTSMRLAIEDYDVVEAISFFYNQKQSVELELAAKSCEMLGVKHKVVDISFLGDIARKISTNINGSDIDMPTINDVLGDPQPVTYVPNRNMIMLSIAASYAETRGIKDIICGFQSNDTYGYHDTTNSFLGKMNALLTENRTHVIRILAPFIDLSKADEIRAVYELDGNVDLYKNTITCYNPYYGVSCGVCPSCAERLKAFADLNLIDPIEYQQ